MATKTLSSVEKDILSFLKAEFIERGYTREHLRDGYEGPKLEPLFAALTDHDRIDLDIAIDDLTSKGLISTGPMELVKIKNDDPSIFIMPFFASKKEYVNLTEKGYQSASNIKTTSRNWATVINNNNFHAPVSNAQFVAGNNNSQTMNVDSHNDSQSVREILALLQKEGVTIDDTKQREVIEIVSEAEKGNGGKVKQLISTVFHGVSDVAVDAGKAILMGLLVSAAGL
ncbi:hypothetical protein [Escherichia albertii]|uniref:hypothetical protein n=1 Tax=Escherichia albertii TaxID=208962 RepID=UPI0013752551|nr:hypothetical protein [Escherichia albertii]MCE7711238.1 hypothetical protein [Escherichia albertii]MCQ8911104.1 hypothetical protein [Escherichia albertii]MCQ8921082.1 hypothetical protein [Escherichia albertii]MCQ8937298.1 hypothetical protein [Escherichia albertii]MCQ8951266.1 hypothetical protein [Escherichia albertii]